MATQLPLFTLPGFKAGADMSDDQFHLVKITDDEEVQTVDNVDDIPLGVLQNAPTSGETAQVMHLGISKVVADTDGISAGSYVVMTGDGQVEDAGTSESELVIGVGVDEASDGNIGSILLYGRVIDMDLS